MDALMEQRLRGGGCKPVTNPLPIDAEREWPVTDFSPLRSAAPAGTCDISWLQWINPVDDQGQTGLCWAFAFAGGAEAFYRRGDQSIAEGEQIDAELIAREVGVPLLGYDCVQEGATRPDGWRVMLAAGVFPPDNELRQCQSLDDETAGLEVCPLFCGHNVTPEWERPSAVNGYFRPEGKPDGGHATIEVARLVRAGNSYEVYANSWGRRWGWYGCGMMHRTASRRTQVPDGKYRLLTGPYDARTWTGWRKWLRKK